MSVMLHLSNVAHLLFLNPITNEPKNQVNKRIYSAVVFPIPNPSCVICPFRKLYPDVMVVQPRQDWDGYNDPGPLHCPTQGRVLAQRQVRADLIIVVGIRRKNLPQVCFAEDQHPVQALATHRANQPLYIRILPRRVR